MPVDEAPDDEDVRQTYNFAPGNHGLVYRADVPDYGARGRHGDTTEDGAATNGVEEPKETRYKLQSMKWGVCDTLHVELSQFAGFITKSKQDWYPSGQNVIQTTALS